MHPDLAAGAGTLEAVVGELDVAAVAAGRLDHDLLAVSSCVAQALFTLGDTRTDTTDGQLQETARRASQLLAQAAEQLRHLERSGHIPPAGGQRSWAALADELHAAVTTLQR